MQKPLKSEIWHSKEREVALLRITERAMMKATNGIKRIYRKNANKLQQTLALSVPIERKIRSYFANKKRPKSPWKKQVKTLIKEISLKKALVGENSS